ERALSAALPQRPAGDVRLARISCRNLPRRRQPLETMAAGAQDPSKIGEGIRGKICRAHPYECDGCIGVDMEGESCEGGCGVGEEGGGVGGVRVVDGEGVPAELEIVDDVVAL